MRLPNMRLPTLFRTACVDAFAGNGLQGAQNKGAAEQESPSPEDAAHEEVLRAYERSLAKDVMVYTCLAYLALC